MSLTSDDLNEIRNIIEPALDKQNSEVIKPIQGELEALRNDIRLKCKTILHQRAIFRR